MTTDIIVIDVSHWQGDWPGPDTPFEAMNNNGIVGVVLKATEGVAYVDPTYRERYDACYDNSVAVSSYHFLRHGSIDSQMQLFLDTVDPVQGERMVLDWEDPGVTLDELKQAAEYLLNDNRNLQVTVYASSSFLTENVPDEPDEVLIQTSLWVARYSDQEPYWPTQVWPTWSLWQCTDKFTLEGYGPLDGNKFNGTVEGCMKWLAPAGSEPVPAPSPGPAPMADLVDYQVRVSEDAVAFDIAVRPDVAIAVKVNDTDWRPA